MATLDATRAAARKLAGVRGVLWPSGPACTTSEIKKWDIDLADLLMLVATVERAAPSTPVAAQWLRRMYYSPPVNPVAGGGFDRFIATDRARSAWPMITSDVPQAVLDSLIRIGSVRIPGAMPPLDLVEISHVFVLLDLRLNGSSRIGAQFDALWPDTNIANVLSWVGDLGSAWLGYQKSRNAAERAEGDAWSEPVATPADLARPLAWLEDGIRGRVPIDDLLGDLDAQVLAAKDFPGGPTPIATMLRDYYTVGVPSSGTVARVDDRFPQWVTRAVPQIPFVAGDTAVELLPSAREHVHDQIYWGLVALLDFARAGANKAKVAAATPFVMAELSRPWNARMVDELADRFTAFLADGLAGRTVNWPAQPLATVPYPGYSFAPSGRAGPLPTVRELEAIAQFHLNWRQPHVDLRPDRTWRPFRLRNPAGRAATAVAGGPAGSARVQVEEFTELDGIVSASGEHVDLLRLDGDTSRPSRTYRIIAFDLDTRTFTVDGVPTLGGPSAWTVVRAPRLVAIDPFAARMEGLGAVPRGSQTFELPVTDLDRIRANLDAVLLFGDTFRASRTYRIVAVDPDVPRIKLDAGPVLTGATSSSWRIGAAVVPAGLADALTDVLDPVTTGLDVYEGFLFMVTNDDVLGGFPVTSYSSAVHAADPDLGSSIIGNRRFAVRSLRSPTASSRNYELAVTDFGKEAEDLVAEAAFFSAGVTALRTPTIETPAAPVDPSGKVNIRIHIGNRTGSNAGSTGDLVAPGFPELREQLIGIHQLGRRALGLADDPALAAVAAAVTQPDSVALYDSGTVGDAEYNDKLHAELVLIRPDQRPTAG